MSTPSPYGQPGYPDAGQQPGYPNAGYGQPGYGTGVAPKSKVTAALLAFFLGGIGAHNFYLGQKGRAVGHIVLAVAVIILSIVFVATTMNTAMDAAASGRLPGRWLRRRDAPRVADCHREQHLGPRRVHHDPRQQGRLAPVSPLTPARKTSLPAPDSALRDCRAPRAWPVIIRW